MHHYVEPENRKNRLLVTWNTFLILVVLLKMAFFFLTFTNKDFQIFITYFYPYRALVFALKNKQVVGGKRNICCFFCDSQVLLYFLKNTKKFFPGRTM